MSRRSRLRRSGLVLVTTLVFAGLLSPAIAIAAQLAPPPDGSVSVDPASQPYKLPPVTSPLSAAQTKPLMDWSGTPGVWPGDVVETIPGVSDAKSPAQAVAGAIPLPAQGGPSVDAFGFGPNKANHIALIYAEDLNNLKANGNWSRLALTLSATDSGWTYTDPSGSRVDLPASLSAKSPVTITTASGEVFTLAPAGPDVTGQASGASVTYPGAFPGADLVYTLAPDGLQERIVLASAPAASTFSFALGVKGLQLSPNAFGGIDVRDAAGAEVATLPVPLAYDAHPEPASAVGTYVLTDHGDGSLDLEVSIDPAWLATAVYPVVIDPAWRDPWNHTPSRDGYTDQGSPSTSYESGDYLVVDSGKRIYLNFNTDAIEGSEVIVYDAQVLLYPNASGGVTGGIEARRVTDVWPAAGTLSWNNQMAIGTAAWDTVSASNSNGGWWDWNVTELYQHYIDQSNVYNTHWTNNGVSLVASGPKTFYSADATLAGSDPVLYVTYNTLPNAPTLDEPASGKVSETESLTLSVDRIPSDPEGDDVMVAFQISDDGVNWSGTDLVFQSPYDDSTTYTVPAGVFTDGRTYYWRAVSRDVCGASPTMLCLLTDGANTPREMHTSGVRNFSVQLQHFGHDDRWAMWSQDVGNGMSLEVNQANGNLFLDVPLGSYATPIGPMNVSLGYNSLDSANLGMGTGWDVGVGPRSSAGGLPKRLYRMGAADHSDLKLRFQGGRVLYFPYNYGKVWGGTSALSGLVRKDGSNTWTYVDADGGVFNFGAGIDTSSGAQLQSAKPAASGSQASNKEFTYTYDASLQLTEVADPLTRKVLLGWTSGKLTSISAADFGAPLITLGYDATTGKLQTITRSVTNAYAGGTGAGTPVTTPEVLTFAYDANARLSQVQDGVQSAASGDGWDITYSGTRGRVDSITAPSTGSPAASPATPTAWRFGYVEKSPATQNAAFACLTDPRNTAGTLTCDSDFGVGTNDDAYQTQTQFSDAGLPIKVGGPILGSFRPISTYVFDSHNNLRCERTPEANAIGGESCTSATDANGVYNDLDLGGFSTLYAYASGAPYRLLTVTRPAPAAGGDRLVESYGYDEGSSFNGLWAQEYRNDTLTGTANAEQQWSDLSQTWTAAGSPAALADPDGEHWGLRIAGSIDISDLGGAKKYKFRVFSDDGVRVSVEGKTILDCFGTAQDASVSNCGTGTDVGVTLWGTATQIQIEYADLTGPAELTVKWDKGDPTGGFAVPAASRLSPDLGLVTSKTYQRLSGGATTDRSQEAWTFPDDDAKSRRLQASHTLTDLSATPHLYTTSYTYDATYGRLLTETSNAQDPASDVKTTYSYTDGPAGWIGGKVSCMTTSVTDTVPATDPITTNYQCDNAGRTTLQTLSVQAVAGTDQGAQTRSTQTAYDSVGRVARARQVQTGAEQISVYDASGRAVQTRQLISGTTYAIATNTYDHAGHLASTKLPDPATGAQNTGSPVISHLYDWAGNELQTTNPNAHTTSFLYDALGRVTRQTSATGLQTNATYQLGTSLNQVVVDSPSGVSVTTAMDVLGRTLSSTLESYAATTTTYDVAGNVTSVTDPAGITTSSTYSGLGEVLTRTDYSQGASAATTTYAYDASGRLASVDGPRAGTGDQLTYAYDPFGRLSKTTHEGILLNDGLTKASVTVVSNDAGERIEIRSPLTTTTAVDRFFTYDAAGHQTQARTENGPTDTSVSTSYNLAGWATKQDDNRTTDVFMGYDFLGQMVCRHTAACTGTTSGAERFTYDAAGNLTSAIAATAAPTFTMTYDPDERLAVESKAGVAETTYTYGTTGLGTGLLSSILDPAGTTTYTYNAAGQVLTLDDPLVTTSGSISSYAYDATSGRLATRTDVQANLRWNLAYEPTTGRLDTQVIKDNTTLTALASFDLGYDAAGNVTSKASTVFSNASNATWGYTYDPTGRLIQATGKNAAGAATTWEYAYDGGGNRTGAKETTGATVVANWTTNFDARGLAAFADNAVGGEHVNYYYDVAGMTLTSADSTTSANDWAYTYDAFSRLTCARSAATACGSTAAAGRVAYTLDAFSRAWQRNENGSIITYSYRGMGETLAKSVLGTTTTKYALTWGGSPLGQKVGTAAASYYLRDPHGDAVGIVSAAGANQGTTAFDPWGKVLGTSGTQPVFGYQSDLTDPLTRQVDMGTRWYAPQTGRFSSQDVLFGDPLHPISLNQWVYGADSPVTRWDPTGMLDAIADGGSSNTLSSCAYGPHPGCRGYDGGVVNGPHVTTYVAPPPPPDPPEPKAFEVVNPRAAAMQYAYADAQARASDDDPGCGFFGWRCYDDVAGAGLDFVGEHARGIGQVLSLAGAVGCIVVSGGMCAIIALGTFTGKELLYGTAVVSGHMSGGEFVSNTGWNLLETATMSGMGGAGNLIDDSAFALESAPGVAMPVASQVAKWSTRTFLQTPNIACALACPS